MLPEETDLKKSLAIPYTDDGKTDSHIYKKAQNFTHYHIENSGSFTRMNIPAKSHASVIDSVKHTEVSVKIDQNIIELKQEEVRISEPFMESSIRDVSDFSKNSSPQHKNMDRIIIVEKSAIHHKRSSVVQSN